MKRYLLIIFLVASQISRAQPYGNEWIVNGQPYYKIYVSADGIYRLPVSVLLTPIPNIIGSNTSSVAMFHNGQEVPLYVSSNTTFGANDYIEFYGERNKGYIDSLLYRSAYDQINPDFSLFTNNSVYYLTVNNSPNNLRFTLQNYNPTPHPQQEDFFWHKSIVSFFDNYFEGDFYQSSGTELYKSTYDPGEGYASGTFFGRGSPVTYSVPTPFVYTQGPDATTRTFYANNSNEGSFTYHSVLINLNNYGLITSPVNVTGFKLNKPQFSVPVSQLTTPSSNVTFSDFGNCISQRQNVVGYIEIEYPRKFDFGDTNRFFFKIAGNDIEKYFEISNFNSHNTQPLLYDFTTRKIYRSVLAVGSSPLKFKIVGTTFPFHDLYLRADENTAYTTITEVTPITFHSYPPAEYYIISNKSLMADSSGNDPVKDYSIYRSAKFNPSEIADIDVLYDQFAYGIRKSPLAIRNFIHYMKNTFGLKYVFLIGKGRESFKVRVDGTADAQCLVPTFGYPGSDNLLAASRTSDTMIVAIGRLAALSRTQVTDYLNKMKDYEREQDAFVCPQGIDEKIWQKKILHFSGGSSSGEQSSFRFYVDSYARTAIDTFWGVDTTTYSKNSSQPIDQSLSQIIKNRINAGVSWITFFGHSATGAFDFSIDDPERYNNHKRYPIILSNGCFSGFIHDVNPGYSERFVLVPDKGAIAFMATSSLSLPTGLHAFSSNMYLNVCRKNYLQPLGKSFMQSYNDVVCCTSDAARLGVAYEFTLHGDPGLSPNQYPKPDYAIEQSSVSFNPQSITAGVDSFEVNVEVTNLGKAIRDSIVVSLKRKVFNSGGTAVEYTYRKTILAPYYKRAAVFKLPTIISTLGYGQNFFYPYVDADYKVDEMDECNNGLTTPVEINIQSDDIIPIYPYEFAIDSILDLTLKASTVNPFAPVRDYTFEIDTSELFTKKSTTTSQSAIVNHAGGVVPWKPSITLHDSTVYYWRVKKASAPDSTYRYSSFIYLKGEYPGWNQSHYYQWKKDNFINVSIRDTERIFKFPSITNGIRVRTGYADANGVGNLDWNVIGWYYNSVQMHAPRTMACGYFYGGITFGVIDGSTGKPWASTNGADGFADYGDQFYNIHCANLGPQYGFDFPTGDQNWANAIKTFIEAIPNGDFIVFYSVNDPVAYPWSWTDTLIAVLTRLGFDAQAYHDGAKTGPFMFFCQKGNSTYNATANVTQLGPPPPHEYSILDTSLTFPGTWYQGEFSSPLIGPSFDWGSAHWRSHPFEVPDNNKDTLDIIGVKSNGIETLLLSTVDTNILSLNANVIPASTYPYMRLRMRTRDDVNRTPGQLQYWRVLYKKVPEAAINPSRWFKLNTKSVPNDTMNIGQALHLEIALDNVTDIPMNKMLTKYTVRDATLASSNKYIRYDSLLGLATMNLIFDTMLNSNKFAGLNKIIIEANPDNDQLEQYHFNNIAEVNFTGRGDNINPLLDVTFDGVHIFDGDIVSAKPEVVITLKDENKFLALDSNALIDVYLKYPNISTPTKIPYDNTLLTFIPANAANLARDNKAKAVFKPDLNIDGKYELIISDRDRSNNNSSTVNNRFIGNIPFDYKISFEVINKPMITNMLNYPNPFTTATKFVFTVTGSEVPDFLKIRIMTIKGTVVKEIMKDELGELHVGRNITQYTWDGRDEYGDLLANGIYFYTVVARLDDKRMDHMSQDYDKYFKKGFGKMAIVR